MPLTKYRHIYKSIKTWLAFRIFKAVFHPSFNKSLGEGDMLVTHNEHRAI